MLDRKNHSTTHSKDFPFLRYAHEGNQNGLGENLVVKGYILIKKIFLQSHKRLQTLDFLADYNVEDTIVEPFRY